MTKLKLHRLGDERYDRTSFLIIGEPEVGKTSLVRQLDFLLKQKDGKPDWSRLLFIAGEEGHKSISDLRDIAVWVPFKDGKPGELVNALQDQSEFDVIFIDGLDSIMRDVFTAFEDAEMKKPNPNMMQVWGHYGKAMLNWMSQMVKLPNVTVFFTIHPHEDATAAIRYGPRTQGGKMLTPEVLLGMFDYVFYMKWHRIDPKKPPVRTFMTTRDQSRGGDPRYAAKSRVPMDRQQLPGAMKIDGKDGDDMAHVWKILFDKETK